jgi:hypothetical protein
MPPLARFAFTSQTIITAYHRYSYAPGSSAVMTLVNVTLFTAHMANWLVQMDAQSAIVKTAMGMVLVVVAASRFAVEYLLAGTL